MNYIEYDFTVTPIELGVEILVAELAEVGFESFVDTPTGIKAYIPKNLWREDVLEDVSLLENEEFTIRLAIFQAAKRTSFTRKPVAPTTPKAR